MAKNRPVLYLDTCAIIEAYRVKCWRQLAERYDLHTVRKCREELESGNPHDPEYISVDLPHIDLTMTIHAVVQEQRVRAAATSATFGGLDEGERDLLAWCLTQAPTAMIITTGDRAAIFSACELGLKDSLLSLDEIVVPIGVQANLKKHYRRDWLAELRTNWTLDNI